QLRLAAARGQITFAFGIGNPCRRRTFAHRGDPLASAFRCASFRSVFKEQAFDCFVSLKQLFYVSITSFWMSTAFLLRIAVKQPL
ncbi:hypothetical protein, partial [Geobacillus thermoleovorans]|uniref:hypothetical protein n=1 Tax=Geobacillus thermoleovorans TaxID=33941 RepID=UPI003D1BD47F